LAGTMQLRQHQSVTAIGLDPVARFIGISVYFTPLSDLVSTLAKAEREGTLREKIRFFCRFSLHDTKRAP